MASVVELMFSKLNKTFFRSFDPETDFWIIEINASWRDLADSDTLIQKKVLSSIDINHIWVDLTDSANISVMSPQKRLF